MALPVFRKSSVGGFPIQCIGRNRGLVAPAISFRFRHSRRTGKILPVNVAALAEGWRFFKEKYYPTLDRQESRAKRLATAPQSRRSKSRIKAGRNRGGGAAQHSCALIIIRLIF